MDLRQVGRAGLVGWRVGVADRVARRLARHSRFDAVTIQEAMGVLFVGIAVWYLIGVARRLARS